MMWSASVEGHFEQTLFSNCLLYYRTRIKKQFISSSSSVCGLDAVG